MWHWPQVWHLPHWHELKDMVTCITLSSDFVLYLNVDHCKLSVTVLSCKSVCTMFQVPAILPYIFKTVWGINVELGILIPCDNNSFVCQCDLYFTVQWLWLLFWRQFDRWMSYLGYWLHITSELMSQYILFSVTYILQSGDFILYLKH